MALHDERLGDEIPQTVELHHPRNTRRGILLRDLLQHDIRRIRQRRTAGSLGHPRLLGRDVRPTALLPGIPQLLDDGMVRTDHHALRGGYRLQRDQRIFLLERIRSPLQLHRRGLPGLYQRGRGQHHGILPRTADVARDNRSDAAHHLVPFPPRPGAGRPADRMALEGCRRAGLYRSHATGGLAAAFQYPVPGQRQRLRERIASQRTLQVLRRVRQERTRLRTVLHHRARSQGRGVRTRCVRQHGRQPACRPQRGARDTAQHRTDNDREHERLVHGAFRQHQAADARARLALRPEPGVRPRLCHG